MALSNRQLLLNQRNKKKGLPDPPIKATPIKTTDFSSKVNRPTPKKTGIQTKGLPPEAEPVDIEKATEGIADTGTALAREFSGFKSKTPVDNLSEAKSNFSIAPQRVAKPKPDRGFSFGLPTDRLPSFAELGGAIGQMFKHLGGISKRRKALGLIPGKVNIPTAGKGLSLTDKDRATILTKRLDDLTLTDEERVSIKSELDAILHPAQVEESTDINAILNE